MEPHHHQHQYLHHHHQQQQLLHPLHQNMINSNNTSSSTSGGVGGHVEGSDRFPQWGMGETKEFLRIRGELDQRFMETKRNKKLWEVISNKMKEKGYNRSSEQCKCKWKNLVTRYKGCETMEAEAMRQQFPFYNELQAIFTARMQRMLWAEAEESSKKKAMHQSSDEEEEDGNNNNEESEDQKGITRKKKKAKIVGSGDNNGNILSNLKEILEEFMRQQMQMEAQWMEAFEAKENERRAMEMEWRQAMQTLENERIMMDQRWREREEQRRVREEARAERRDALITTLLDKLAREEGM